MLLVSVVQVPSTCVVYRHFFGGGVSKWRCCTWVASLSDMGHFKSGFNGRQSNISDTGKKLESVIETRRVNPAQSMEEEHKRSKRKEERRRMKKEKEKKQFV